MYETFRRQYNISHALVVGYEGDERYRGNNDELERLVQIKDWVVPLAFINTDGSFKLEQAVRRLGSGFRGFSLYLGDDGSLATQVDPALWPILAASGAIVSLNATPKALGEAHALLTAFEGARILISHLGLPSLGAASADDLTGRMGPLLQLANTDLVSVKVSGLYAIDPIFPHTGAIAVFDALLDAFGPERLLWGSDFAPGLDVLSPDELFAIPQWMQARLSEVELRQVMSENLLAILRKN